MSYYIAWELHKTILLLLAILLSYVGVTKVASEISKKKDLDEWKYSEVKTWIRRTYVVAVIIMFFASIKVADVDAQSYNSNFDKEPSTEQIEKTESNFKSWEEVEL